MLEEKGLQDFHWQGTIILVSPIDSTLPPVPCVVVVRL